MAEQDYRIDTFVLFFYILANLSILFFGSMFYDSLEHVRTSNAVSAVQELIYYCLVFLAPFMSAALSILFWSQDKRVLFYVTGAFPVLYVSLLFGVYYIQ